MDGYEEQHKNSDEEQNDIAKLKNEQEKTSTAPSSGSKTAFVKDNNQQNPNIQQNAINDMTIQQHQQEERIKQLRNYQQSQNSFTSLFSSDAMKTPSSRQFNSLPRLFASLDASYELSRIYHDLPPPPLISKQKKMKPTYALLISYNGTCFKGGFEYNSQFVKSNNGQEEEEIKT
eukprot:7509308-Ditylum_brightwellii.AAC.1